MYSQNLKSVCRVLALACAALMPIGLVAQSSAKPAGKNDPWNSPSKWDIFAGYSYLAPKGTVEVPQANGQVLPFSYKAVNVGGLFSVARFFNNYAGVQLETGLHEWGIEHPPTGTIGTHGNNDGFTTIAGGLILRYPTESLTPFVHGLVGGALVDGPDHNPFTWGPALTAGGGVDYETPWFNHHLALRIFQADYEYIHANFGPGVNGGRANINAARLSTGLVYHIGTITPPPAVTMTCSASPASVFQGEPVTVTGTPENVNPKMNAIYSWTGDGVTGSGTTANVNTANLAPGTYTVKGDVKEGKKGKEGLKPGQSANCSATYTVKEFEPPTISCSANPSTIKPGETSTITSTAMSPQNRPLTYSYTTAGGTIEGTGNTANFNSAGAPTGPVEITCKVADDKGHTATANTSVTITPPPPVVRHTQALCSLSFDKDKRRPTRVDNEAKACLDEVALDLQKESDAKAVVVGNSDAKEKAKTAKQQKYAAKHKKAKVEDFAAQRAVNAKDYLVKEKGIDPSRVSVATGAQDAQTVEDYLVPAGATFGSDVQGTTPVDESSVAPQVRKALAQRHHAKAKAKAKATN